MRRRTLITVLLLAVPRAAFACPVCFGQSDSPMAWSVNMGIFAMLAVTGGVLAGFATFFVHLVRRARLAADQSPDVVSGFSRTTAGSPRGGRHSDRFTGSQGGHDAQEGTAEC